MFSANTEKKLYSHPRWLFLKHNLSRELLLPQTADVPGNTNLPRYCLHLFHCVATLDCNGMQPVCVSEFICIPSNPSFVAFFCGVPDISSDCVVAAV